MYQYIFWDWNGTVIDDVGVAWNAVNQMLRERSYPEITLQRYRELMDTPIIHFYEPIFDLDKYPFAGIAEEFQQLYRQGAPQPYAAIPGLLQRFHQQGRHQIVLTSSQQQSVQTAADALSLLPYFDAVLGADDIYARSKAERAMAYLQQAQAAPEQCILIGDTVHDYEVACSMGIDCILLASGHDDRESLDHCGCMVYDSPEQLPTVNF